MCLLRRQITPLGISNPVALQLERVLPVLKELGSEILQAMDDRALVAVYRLLVELEQFTAADLLAQYAQQVGVNINQGPTAAEKLEQARKNLNPGENIPLYRSISALLRQHQRYLEMTTFENFLTELSKADSKYLATRNLGSKGLEAIRQYFGQGQPESL